MVLLLFCFVSRTLYPFSQAYRLANLTPNAHSRIHGGCDGVGESEKWLEKNVKIVKNKNKLLQRLTRWISFFSVAAAVLAAVVTAAFMATLFGKEM